MASTPSNVEPKMVGSNCLFVNTGENAENIPIRNTNINATIILVIIPNDMIDGGTPMNNTEKTHPSTNMKNPLVK